MEPDRSRVQCQDEVQCKWSPARGKVPIRLMHKKNTAVKRQPTMKDVSKMHTIAEDTHEVEKDETKRRGRSRTCSRSKAGRSR